ncbi:MAG: hypothetical protein WB975_13565, partial [Nitrososphaeraceae archaeon]
IRVDRKKGVTRYYPIHISSQVSKIIGHIKHQTSRQVLSFLVQNGPCRLDELVQLTNKAPLHYHGISNDSWNLALLRENIVFLVLIVTVHSNRNVMM